MQTKITLKKQISTYCQLYIIILYCLRDSDILLFVTLIHLLEYKFL